VAQVVAYKLGVPLDMVTVQRTNTITSANSETTGGSVTSEAVCQVWIIGSSTLTRMGHLTENVFPITRILKHKNVFGKNEMTSFSGKCPDTVRYGDGHLNSMWLYTLSKYTLRAVHEKGPEPLAVAFKIRFQAGDILVRVECTNDYSANPLLTLEFNRRYSLNHSKYWFKR